MTADIQMTEYGPMSSSLICSKLSVLCIDKIGVQTGPFGSQLHKEDYVENGTPIITVEHLGNNRIIHTNTPFVSDKDKARLSKYHLTEGDIVFSRVGSVDRRALVRKQEEGWLFSGRCLRVRADKTKIDPTYLSYFFGLEGFKNYIRSIAVGATMPSINTKILSDIPIYYPESLEEQRKIANLFYTGDEKIELNRQTNQTLEQIAQAMFKSWFVDFEPVRAKIAANAAGENAQRAAMAAISGLSITPVQAQGLAAGAIADLDQLEQQHPEQYQQLQATADLFPDNLIGSELGEIPEGWEVKTLSKIIKVIGGGTPKRSETSYWGGTIPWFSVRDVPAESDIFVVDTTEKITEVGMQKSSTKLLPKGTTIITARGTVGKLALVATPMCMNQSCYGIQAAEGIGPYFNFFNLREAISTLLQNTHGAVFDTITTQTFESYSMPVASRELIQAFDELVEPLLKKVEQNIHETTGISELRDTLLPKLLSGELSNYDRIEVHS